MATPGMDTQSTSLRTELDLITEQELASHLKICRRQLYNWRVGGLIPYFKMGKAVRFRVAGEEEDLVVFREGSDGLDGGGAAGGVHVGEGVVEEEEAVHALELGGW